MPSLLSPETEALAGGGLLACDRYSRLRETATFRGDALERWQGSRLLLVGAGALGSRLAPELVLSGAATFVCDPDQGGLENLGTQRIGAGTEKVVSVVQTCDAIARGRAEGLACDVRHLGVGVIRQFDAIIDCSDDPNLAVVLTEISNGCAIPLLRSAVDGTGRAEWGRVLTSHGGAEHSCQLCSYSVRDLQAHFARMPCPHLPGHARAPTLAGGALATTVAGLGLLQAQRLLGGNDRGLVLDREVILDLDNFETHCFELTRSSRCLSGHVRWDLTELGRNATETTVADCFAVAREELGDSNIIFEPYLHPICVGAICSCSATSDVAGTAWAARRECPRCGESMTWRQDLKWPRLRVEHCRELGICDVSLAELGLPERGAMVHLRTATGGSMRLVLE